MNKRLEKLFSDMKAVLEKQQDPEGNHSAWDGLMEEFISEKGGEEIITWLSEQKRWYA